MGGSLSKIVAFGTKYFLYPLFKACPLFGMSAIGRFHSITMKIKGFGRVWLLFLLYRWDNEEGGMFQYHFRRGKEH